MDPEVSKFLKSMRDSLNLVVCIFEALPEVVSVPDHTNEQYLKFLYINTEKALRLANGGYYSCHHGHPIGGIGAARSIYEICTAIQYVNKVPKDRIKDFAKKETETHHEWSDSKIETIAKKSKKDDYKSVYGNLSHISHIGTMLMDDYMEKAGENEIQIKFKLSNEEYCIRALSAIYPCLKQIFKVFMEAFRVQLLTSSCIGKTKAHKPSKTLILAGNLLEYARSHILGELEPVKSPISSEDRYLVFLYIHTHLALDLAHGAYHSCWHGWPIGGVGAVRSIYETCLNVMYIKSGGNKPMRNEHLERFMMSVTEGRHAIMEAKIWKDPNCISEEKKKKIGNQYKKYKAKYKNAIPPYEKNKWAGISVKQMAQEVGWEKTYKRVYERLSQISHVSEITISDEVKEQAEREIHFNSNLDQNDEYLLDVLDVIFEYIPLILDEYIEAFMEPPEIQRPRSVIRNIQNDYRKEVSNPPRTSGLSSLKFGIKPF